MTVQNDSNTTYTFRHNGTDLGTPSTGSSGTDNALRIGARRVANSEVHDDAIAQILHTADILTTGEMEEVESYHADKWGITI